MRLVRLALIALALFLAATAAATAPARGEPACVAQGKKWLEYDAHGGANPKLTATGTNYYVNVMGVTCAYAKGALAKMFPQMRRPPYGKTLTLVGGPTGFKCRSQAGNRPDVGYGGQCANIAAHKIFTWMPYTPKA